MEASLTGSSRFLETDRILQGLLRPLLSKRRMGTEELESLLADTAQRILAAMQAEALLLYHLDAAQISRLTKVYRSRAIGMADEPSPQESASSRSLAGITVRTSLVVPLLGQGQQFGSLQVVNKFGVDLFTIPEFDAADADLLREVALYGAPLLRKLGLPSSEIELSENETTWLLARISRLEGFEPPPNWRPDLALLGLVGEAFLRRLEILPIEKSSAGGVKLAMANPLDVVARDAFRTRTGLQVEKTVVMAPTALRALLDKAFPPGNTTACSDDSKRPAPVGPVHGGESSESSPATAEDSDFVIHLANRIIEDAFSEGASDIHIEPFENEVKVRLRVDGCLKEVSSLPASLSRALVSRLKIMTRSMDITENRLPQDGRIKLREFYPQGPDIDLRVSTAPLAYGQKIVMRILDRGKTALGLDTMGFSATNLRIYRENIQKPYGMVLHVGPTGSGKTTTLYSALAELNKPDINIQTAEDPIEYMLPNVNHMQMQTEIGLTFAAALRCFLRQDPDIILVGEVRDVETAEIAIEAALTGHLIFSTLHTNDAPGTVTRFVEMGVEPFLISSSLLVVCAQRLMRKLCSHCRVECQSTPHQDILLGVKESRTIFKADPGGCSHCKNAGYKGRIGVHEIMTINEPMKALIAKAVPGHELRAGAIANGMVPLYDDAMAKVLAGVTSVEEALSVVKKE